MPKAEAMVRYIDECGRQLHAYSTRDATGGGSSGSAGRMLVSLLMLSTAMTRSALGWSIGGGRRLTTARARTVASKRGEGNVHR
jgi:hypothetical protein